MAELVDKVISIAHHRNGISGQPFNVVLFKHDKKRMVGILFDRPGCYCAVLEMEKLTAGDIGFASNSWRGDRFHDELLQAIQQKEAKDGT